MNTLRIPTHPVLAARPSEPEISLVVVDGVADEFAVMFFPGVPVEPFGVGARGHWRVQALAVHDVHLYLTYDGSRLFAAAAQDAATWVDGVPLAPSRWTQLTGAGQIAFGAARIQIRHARASPPAPAPPAQRPGTQTLVMPRNEPRSSDANVATLIAPFDSRQLGLPESRGAAHEPTDEGATIVGSVWDHLEQPPPGREEPAHPRAGAAPGVVLRRLRAVPLERRALLLLAVLSVGAAALIAARIRHPPKQADPPRASASQSEPPSTGTHPGVPPQPAPAGTVAAQPADGAPAPPVSAVAPSTLEREAVDALARGMFVQAASLYDRLAQAHPGDPRFREAARLARRRGASSEPRE